MARMTLPLGIRTEVITFNVKTHDGMLITQGLATEELALARVERWFADYLKGPVTIERVTYTAFRHTEEIGSYMEAPE